MSLSIPPSIAINSNNFRRKLAVWFADLSTNYRLFKQDNKETILVYHIKCPINVTEQVMTATSRWITENTPLQNDVDVFQAAHTIRCPAGDRAVLYIFFGFTTERFQEALTHL